MMRAVLIVATIAVFAGFTVSIKQCKQTSLFIYFMNAIALIFLSVTKSQQIGALFKSLNT